MIRPAALLLLLTLYGGFTYAQDDNQALNTKMDVRPPIAPDIREDEMDLKVQRGNFVAVPIPVSDPTLGEGLVAGAAYFYPQTEVQKEQQPASVTALAAMYTNNDSKAIGLVQQNYWKGNDWRFTGAVGAADLRLSLLTADQTEDGRSLFWRLDGKFLSTKLTRRLGGNWYGGMTSRLIDANQSIELPEGTYNFDTSSGVRSIGVGAVIEYDTRDNPLNSYSGRYFTVAALFNDETLGSDATYQSYNAAFRSYHSLADSLVLAWEVQTCSRHGFAPLWDACTIKLRGFAATDYLGEVSTSGQAEVRWRLNERWGLVGFAGAGYSGNSFNGIREHEPIPSYGAGLRFSVLKAKRINLRLDYARSTDSDAVYVSVGEAF